MNYLMAFTLLVSIQKGISINFFQQSPTTFQSTSSSTSTTINNSHQYGNQQHHSTECGIRPARRQPRKEKQQQQQRQHNNQHNQNKYNNFDHNQNHYNSDQQKYQQQSQHNQQQQQKQQQQQYQQKRHHDVNNNFFHNFRIPKIIAGSPTKEGQFPWQASLELLHPSMGFLGHWCGGVLVDEFWVLSASHCVHNDLFNLPLAPLWTVVLGEYDRNTESGYEQRIPVEKIILHQSYQHFLHDLVLMKLTMPADISKYSNVRKICLPFIFNENDQSYGDDNIDDDIIDKDHFNDHHNTMMLTNSFKNQHNNHHSNNNNNKNNNNNNFISNKGSGNEDENFFPSLEDFLLNMQGRNKINFTLPSMKELMTTKIANFLKRPIKRPTGRRNSKFPKRRNDKFMTGFKNINIVGSDFKLNDKIDSDDFIKITSSSNGGSSGATIGNENNGGVNVVGTIVSKFNKNYQDEYKDLPYMDCIATGWGKSNMTGDLSDMLLKTNVPLQSNSRCKDAYGSFVKIHKGHLCAGKLNGQGGTCVGDSGGPLQCRLTKNGPWILAGITSFGSGCALEGYPDVYTRTSFYMKWIRDIIENE